MNIHDYSGRYEGALRLVREDAEISEQNRKEILSFAEYCQADGLELPSIVRHMFALRKAAKFLAKPFRDADKNDIIRIVAEIQKATKKDNRARRTDHPLSEESKRNEKTSLKKFYKWLRNCEDDYPDEVRWIKTGKKNRVRLPPENFLTEEEIRRLAESTQNLRDRALILVLYESGCRVGEVLSLRVGDVRFDKYGAVLFVDGKTGQRRVRIIFSSPALAEWLNHHPAASDSRGPLWTSLESVAPSAEPLEYYAFRKMLRDVAVRANITKRVNPHAFRHARASNLASDLTEAQLKELFGWTQDSKMASIYVHLSGRNIDNALLRLSGIKTEEEVEQEEHILRVKTCLRCQENNAPTSRFCTRCGSPLDLKTAMEVQVQEQTTDELMNSLLEDTEVRRLLLTKLRALSSTAQIQVVTKT